MVGLAFQITDDLLDVAGDQEAVGKRLAKDADRGKLTFPTVIGASSSRRTAEELVNEACAMIEVLGSEESRSGAGQICVRARKLINSVS